MRVSTIFLGVGANLGEPINQLKQAARFISRLDGLEWEKQSDIFQSEPWGSSEPQPNYLNAVVQLTIDASFWMPEELMEALLRVEDQMGRVRKERWGPRNIDIDLLAWDQRIIGGDALQLPHPRIRERRFVLQPWAQIAPNWMLHGNSIAYWESQCDGSPLPSVCSAQAWRPPLGRTTERVTMRVSHKD